MIIGDRIVIGPSVIFYLARMQYAPPDMGASIDIVEFVFFAFGAFLTGAAVAFTILEYATSEQMHLFQKHNSIEVDSQSDGQDAKPDYSGQYGVERGPESWDNPPPRAVASRDACKDHRKDCPL